MRRALRDLAGSGLALAGITAPKRRAADRLCIATFHRVLPEPQRAAYPLPGLAVTPEELGWFLDHFQRHYTVGPLAEVFARFEAGERPDKPLLALTFDDAEGDNARHAAPVLARHGVRASFYVPVAHVEGGKPLWHDRLGFELLRALESAPQRARVEALFRTPLMSSDDVHAVILAAKGLRAPEREARIEELEALVGAGVPDWAGMMRWDEVKALADAGHEIGSHSMTHPILPTCTDAELEEEIAGSRAALEARLGARVSTFCYPNGDADDRVAAVTRRAGYVCAVTTTWGNNASAADAMRLRRWDMNAAHARDALGRLSSARLAWRTSGLHPGLR